MEEQESEEDEESSRVGTAHQMPKQRYREELVGVAHPTSLAFPAVPIVERISRDM